MEYCYDHGIPHSKFLQWDDQDQAKVIAWIDYRQTRCPNCGTFPDEWLDKDGRAVDPPPHVVHSMRCYGCKALASERDLLKHEEKGLYFFLIPWREELLPDGP